VLTLTLLCLCVGILFLLVSATAPGFIFIGAGFSAELLCLYLGRSRCLNYAEDQS
jgi:hypothetical protein